MTDFEVRPVSKKPLIYLASPYSNEDPNVVRRRFEHICYIAGRLIEDGYLIYCPIAHSHPIAIQGFGNNWGTWKELDLAMLSKCDEIWVAEMDGWEWSEGVSAEEMKAKELGIPRRKVPDKYMHL